MSLNSDRMTEIPHAQDHIQFKVIDPRGLHALGPLALNWDITNTSKLHNLIFNTDVLNMNVELIYINYYTSQIHVNTEFTEHVRNTSKLIFR